MENLNGSIGMVNGHAADQSGDFRIGIISGLDPIGHRADITFGNLEKSRFDLSQISVLKDRGTLYQLLLSAPTSLDAGDFKTLFKVNMLQDRGDPSSILNAYQLLKESPSAHAAATQSLSARVIAEPLLENRQNAVGR